MNAKALKHQDDTIRGCIRAGIRDFTVSEQKVGRILLAAYPIAGLESVAQLAERAQVSGPTVLRFVSKLGFNGYGDFQDVLRQEVQERLTVPADGDGRRAMVPEEILQISHDAFNRSLEVTFKNLSAAEFERALDLLAAPNRRVFCAGGRFSQVLAFYLFALIDRVRPDCRYFNAEPTLRLRELGDLEPGDILVVFDVYPYQQSTIQFSLRAAQRDVQIVLFTDPWRSPIASQAACVLTSSLESPSLSGSLVSGIAVVETVAAGLAARLDIDARLRIEEAQALLMADDNDRTALGEDGTGWNRRPSLGQR